MSDLAKLKRTSGAMLFAAVFAVSFGGVGAFASWVVGATLWDAWQASGWTKVPAEVLHYDGERVQYRYEVNDVVFTGRRIGIAAIDTDEGNPAGSRIQQALNDKKPLEVLVDPDDPSRSVVDTTINWMMVIGFLPFALGFGAVGLGALGVMVGMMLPDDMGSDGEDEAITSDAGSSFVGLAIFTFLWNAIAFPIAAIMVAEIWKDGEWLGLFVLIFPLVGLLMIWGTIVSGINWIRRGGAELHPRHTPRLGKAFEGHVAFRRGVTPGDAFKAVLTCATSGSKGSGATTHFKAEKAARVADVGGRRRLSLRFDTPDRLKGFDLDAVTSWQLDLIPEGKQASAFTFHFKMQPREGVEHLPEEELDGEHQEAQEAAAAKIAPVDEEKVKRIAGLASMFGANLAPRKQRELALKLEAATPEQKAAFEKAVQYGPLVRKLIFWAIGLFFLIQMIGVAGVFLQSN